MPVKTITNYKNWKPIFHSVMKDETLAQTIHEKGYVVVSLLSEKQITDLTKFYTQEHSLSIENGGMFYSLYSRDLAYRKRVHETIQSILKPILEKNFKDYKNIINTFITKAPGPDSEFYVHQDTTALDEFKHSPLSVWIPLQDITPENGALGVIEKSHWLFSPYRGISFQSPFQNINSTLRAYLKPIYLKAGEAIIFDSRIVHHSMPNTSGKDRLVALCGVFPEEAAFITCFKESNSNDIELIKHDDSFILENESFFYDCHSRPKTGTIIKKVENDFPEMSLATFETLCELNQIPKLNVIEPKNRIHCEFIAEPNGINLTSHCETPLIEEKSMWQKLKTVFS
jgi:Phytanoyl-CoA dioxygenase (PhyH)